MKKNLESKLNLSIRELISRKFCISKNKNMTFLENCNEFTKKIMSVENMVKSFYKVNKLEKLLLLENTEGSLIPYEETLIKTDNKLIAKDSLDENSRKIHLDDSRLNLDKNK